MKFWKKYLSAFTCGLSCSERGIKGKYPLPNKFKKSVSSVNRTDVPVSLDYSPEKKTLLYHFSSHC